MKILKYWIHCRDNIRGNGIVLLVVILATIVLFIGLLLGYFGHNISYEFESDAVKGTYELSSPSGAQVWESALNSSVEIEINGEPEADAVSGRCNLLAGNPKSNKQNFRVTVTMDSDGKTIYQSPVLKPGDRIAYVTLDKILKPGEYPVTAEFAVLNPETGENVGAVDAGVRITVQ